jgi:very-short-patch-repair endonuclease
MTLSESKNSDPGFSGLVLAGIEKLRSKLLDLSMANRLLNFKHSEKSKTHVRIIDAIPEVLFDIMDLHKSLQFAWIDESDIDPADEQTVTFREALAQAKQSDETYVQQKEKLRPRSTRRQAAKIDRALKDRVRDSVGLPARVERSLTSRARELGIEPSYDLSPNIPNLTRPGTEATIQTLFYRDPMESKLAAIREGDKTLLEDAGINALYAAFGFVEWYESSDSDIAAFAPLVFYPVEIQRTLNHGVYSYALLPRDDDIEINQAFIELVKGIAGLEIPTWDTEGTLSDYFAKVESVLALQRRWRLRRWVTIGLFTFAKLAMYNDLDPKKWTKSRSLDVHPVLNDLFIGTSSVSEVTLAPDYDMDSPSLVSRDNGLVTDADSSQHSAVIDVLDGKSIVIQGPPGTGKSQTITNIIAAAMQSGKRVLFLAEKMAALRVVKDRLDNFGLGNFCLEVHSNKTRKTAVLNSLEQRINFAGRPLDKRELRQAQEAHAKARDELMYYVGRMKEDVGETGLTVHQILRANCIRLEFIERLDTQLLKVRIASASEMSSFTREELGELCRDLEARATSINNWQTLTRHPWNGIQNTGIDVFQADELMAVLDMWKKSIAELREKITTASTETGWAIDPNLGAVDEFVHKVIALPEPDDAVVEAIARSIGTQTQLSLLTEIAADVQALAGLKNSVDQCSSNSRAIFELGDAWLRKRYDTAASLELLESRISALGAISNEKRSEADSLERASGALSVLMETFGLATFRRADIDKLVKAISLLQAIARKTLNYRDKVVASEENTLDLERAAQCFETLQRLRIKVNEDFQLSAAPPLPQVRMAAQALQTSGFIRRVFSKECRNARKLYKQLVRIGTSSNRKDPGDELGRISAYLQQERDTVSNQDFRRCAGRFYRGAETPWKELLLVSQWASKVRRAFPSPPVGRNPWRDMLLDGDGGVLDSILAFGQTAEYAFLKQQTANSLSWPSPSLEELTKTVASARNVSAQLAADLEPLRWNTSIRLKELKSVGEKVSEAQGLIAKLAAEKVERLLGSAGPLWFDKARELRQTANYLNALAMLGLPQIFWQRLSAEPMRDVIETLRNHGRNLSNAAAVARESQQAANSLATIDHMRWAESNDLSRVNLAKLETRIEFALENKAALQPYLEFLRVEQHARTTAIAPILEFHQKLQDPYRNLAETFEVIFYRSCAEFLLREDPKLSAHSGATHEQLRKRYQQLDRRIQELCRQSVAETLFDLPVPVGVSRGKASEFTELALIRRQIALQRRHASLRDLFRRAGQAVQALKPCFMMSPMSVAQFLDPEGVRFDLVVMDEASQIRPHDAIGAIARGTQVVIVGDPKQLPPTPFFEKVDRDEDADDDTDEAEVADLTGQESILDLARGPYQPVRRLGWHYRSQHQALIAFSNHEFYEGSLIVFPSPRGNHPDFGVCLEEIDGVYSERVNLIEAEAVVAGAQKFMREFPDRSFGIVAMNQLQQVLIQKMMDDLFATDVEAESYRLRWENTLDKFFVKNLENVQGDERDVIFISTVYGKDSAGNLHQRFGPINGAYGHRRLNVLFTRAKQQVRLFTSMKATDIRIDEKSSLGVKALKHYLAFSKTGHIDSTELSVREPDSEFERWVMQMLNERGYEVVPQLGVSGYFIDLAVRDPDRTGSFILAVECDGATYHSSRSVRDRDRLREEVLKRLDWRIYRIWSTDWFRNPRNEFRKLVETIEALRTSPN